MEDTFKKLHSKSVLEFYSNEEIIHFNNHDISDKNMRCADSIKNYGITCKKNESTKGITCTCEGLKKKKNLLVQKYLESVKY